MSIKLDKDTLQRVLSDKEYEQELIGLLNSAIDSELLKSDDEIDLEYIDECVDILNAIQDGELESVIEKLSEEEKTEETKSNVIKFEQEKKPTTRKVVRLRRIIAVAAIIMIAGTITLQAFPAIADNINEFLEKLKNNVLQAVKESDNGVNEGYSIMLYVPDDDSFTDINNKDEINDKLRQIVVVLLDEDEKPIREVDIKDCVIKQTEGERDGMQYVSVTIAYGKKSTTIRFDIKE